MSWKFTGLITDVGANQSDSLLLDDLEIIFCESASGFTFNNAIKADSNIYALSAMAKNTFLLNTFLGYEYSFEPATLYEADQKLEILSQKMNILVFIFDGRGDFYSFSYFSQGKRLRTWAINAGELYINEGAVLDIEKLTNSLEVINGELPEVFHFTAQENYLINVIENFAQLNFQNELQNEAPNFTFYR